MQLVNFELENLRSIDRVSLEDMSSLNVLIGRNNTGKSTVLAGIHELFEHLAARQIVRPRLEFGGLISPGKDKSRPIVLRAAISLTRSEVAELTHEVRANSQSPAPDWAKRCSAMTVHLEARCVDGRVPYSYLSRLEIDWEPTPPEEVDEYAYYDEESAAAALDLSARRTVLLEVDGGLAASAANKIRQHRNGEVQIQAIQNAFLAIDSDDLEQMSLASVAEPNHEGLRNRVRHALSAGGARVTIDSAAVQHFMTILDESKSIDEFRSRYSHWLSDQRRDATDGQNVNPYDVVDPVEPTHDFTPAVIVLEHIGALRVGYIKDRRERIGEAEARRLLEAKTDWDEEADYERIQKIVSTLTGDRIRALKSKPTGWDVNDTPVPVIDIGGFLAELNGSGVKEAVTIILDIEFNDPQLILVEEPEVHLHPSLARALMEYLREQSTRRQIVLTTHSTLMVDATGSGSVYLTTKEKSTSVTRLDTDSFEESIFRELGLTPSALFMSDRIVFVEGRIDREVLEAWGEKLEIDYENLNVRFVQLDGCGNAAAYASPVTLDFLKKLNVRAYLVVDRDERSEGSIGQLKKDLGDAARPFVLEKREIENYLIEEQPLAEFIRLKLREGNLAASDEALLESAALREEIDRKADALQRHCVQLAIKKKIASQPRNTNKDELVLAGDDELRDSLLESIERRQEHLEAIRSKLQDHIAAAQAEITKDWDRRKRDVVPGCKLLDEVCQTFGVRFHKGHDSKKLAGLFDSDEIHPDIKNILREITR